ncbi:MAG TPA: hypothetical protein ENI92_03480 [Bacteroidetes bacterium]|nr:hypothetical protein [Bacteroidota bacterium]
MRSTGRTCRSETGRLLFLSLALLFLAGCSGNSAAPVSPIDDPYADREYYPMIPGSEWVYLLSDSTRYTYTLLDTSPAAGGPIGRLNVNGSGQDRIHLVWWNGTRLNFANSDTNEVFETSLEIPVELGRRWQAFDFSSGDLTLYANAEIIAMDTTIEVPAGSFPAILVRQASFHQYRNEEPLLDTLYTAFARNVGVILWDFRGLDLRYMLESWTIGPAGGV